MVREEIFFIIKGMDFGSPTISSKKPQKTQGIAEDFQEVKLQLKFSTVWPSFSDFQPIIQLGKLLEVIFVLYKESITTLNNYFLYKISTFNITKYSLACMLRLILTDGVLQFFWFLKFAVVPMIRREYHDL